MSIPWPSSYLAKFHAKILQNFKYNLFTFSEFQKVVNIDVARSNILLSKLRKYRLVIKVFEGRPKKYLLLPIEFSHHYLSDQNLWYLISQLKQERYTPLIILIWKEYFFNNTDIAVGFFGSVSRGSAKQFSDLDVLILEPHLPHGIFARAKTTLELKQRLNPYLCLFDLDINFIILKPDELVVDNPFTLDILEDLVPIFDPVQRFKQLKAKILLSPQASRWKKKYINQNEYYWIAGE